jgi:multidrug efflux pump subunit AcrB
MTTPWSFSVRHWQFTLVVFALLAAVGLAAWRDIPRAEDPSLTFAGASVVVAYPGADPTDIEKLIVDPIEDRINELDDVKKLESQSLDGLGIVTVEFYYGVDPERKYDEVVREMGALRGTLPADVAAVEVRRFKPSLVNIVQLALVSERADYRTLQGLAEDLRDLVETVPGVRKAETWGYPESEIQVAVQLERLARSGIPLGRLLEVLRAQNVTVPGGAVDAGLRRFNLKTSGGFDSLEAVGDTVVGGGGGSVVRLRDVAAISWQPKEERYLARFQGERAVFVTANQKDNENIFRVRDEIYARLDEWQLTLPAGVRLERGFDQSRNVERRLGRLGEDFAIAIALVMLTLLPLGLRAAGIVMIAIPLSLAIGLSALAFAGFSLNQLSIAGFVLALGLLVDDSIVVVENVARWVRRGVPRMEAAIRATDQIWLAVLGCTVTLMLAFLPLVFLPEGSGDFVRSLPAAVLFTVLASLLVAMTVIPFLASRMLRDPAATPATPLARLLDRSDAVADRLLDKLMSAIHRVYGPALRRALAWPRATLVLAFLAFAGAVALVPVIGLSLFPTADIPQFLVQVDAPDGASVAETDRALRFVEEELARRSEVKHWFTNVGHQNPRIFYNVIPSGLAPNIGEVFAEVHEFDSRRTNAMLDELRARFAEYPAARITVKQFENGPPIDAPIAIRISGPDVDQLRLLAEEVEDRIAATPGTRDVDNPVRLQRTDIDLGIDREKASLLGVSPSEVDRTVRLAVAGIPVGRFREKDGDEHDITVRLPMQGRPTLDLLDAVQVSTLSGNQVPLGQVASPHFRTAPNEIRRYARERVVTVQAWPKTGYNTEKLTRSVARSLALMAWPPGYRFAVAGEVEARRESFSGVGPTVLIAMFGIVAVLVLEFGGFRSTLIVAGVIPLGMTGALLALLLTGHTLSFTAVVGLIALVGIEIKNSILLVDFTNQLREQGMDLDRAIEEAGEVRFLPILLTSATAVGGLMPLAVQGSGLYSPLAIVIIGGLVSSTVLARLVTPVMYKLLPPVVTARRAAEMDGDAWSGGKKAVARPA